MISLIIDTATHHLSLALAIEKNNEINFTEVSKDEYKDPSVNLLSDIDTLLKSLKLEINDVDLIIVSKGPGSFTGLRIGLSVAKGLSLALNIPVVSVPNLEAIEKKAEKEYPNEAILSVIDARKRRFYIRLKNSNDEVIISAMDGNIENIKPELERIGKVILTGPDRNLFYEKLCENSLEENVVLDNKSSNNIARELYSLGKKKWLEFGEDDIGEGPLYVRRSDAEEALLKKMEEING